MLYNLQLQRKVGMTSERRLSWYHPNNGLQILRTSK